MKWAERKQFAIFELRCFHCGIPNLGNVKTVVYNLQFFFLLILWHNLFKPQLPFGFSLTATSPIAQPLEGKIGEQLRV